MTPSFFHAGPAAPADSASLARAEARLAVLAEAARAASCPEAAREIEREVIALLEPLGRGLIRRAAPGPTRWAEEVKMSHFRLFALDMWRRRAGAAPALLEDLAARVAAGLAAEPPPAAGRSRREARRDREELSRTHVPAFGGPLSELPAPLIDRVRRHPALPPAWRAALDGLVRAPGETYDPRRGAYVDWVLCRFRKRLWDFVGREEHVVARCGKTESRRRAAAADNAGWGYVPEAALASLAAPGEAPGGEELRLSLERLSEEDRRFVDPLVRWEVSDLKSLARHWGVTPAAVSKRLRRIRASSLFA